MTDDPGVAGRHRRGDAAPDAPATEPVWTAEGPPRTPPRLGTRVVLRYKLPPGYPQPLTDILGELVALTPAVAVRAKDGRVVQVEPGQVVALKEIGARTVATREIRALELAAADGWPGTEQSWIDGWLARSGDRFTRRANAAAPLGRAHRIGDLHSGDTMDRLRSWYADRGQPLTLLLPDRLGSAPNGWDVSAEVRVMAADITNLTLPEGEPLVTVASGPGSRWLSLYHYRGAALPAAAPAVLAAVRDGELGFGALGDPDADLLAITRAAITQAPDGCRWVGLAAVEVAQAHRRRGLGMLICAEMIRWGRDRGATHAYVQVESDNTAAIELYRTLGLIDHHRYRYATAPDH